MKRARPFRKFIFLLFTFIWVDSYSQNNFAYKASIGLINENKFYKIDLPPSIIAKCKPGLEDIRITDDSNVPVPYILKNDLPLFKIEKFTLFPIIKAGKEKDKQIHFTLHNLTGKPVQDLLIFIKNTNASRSFSISGSDDNSQWFVVKENIRLDNSFNNEGETIVQRLSFPQSNYKYFQLTILGEDVLPFNVIKAGTYNEDLSYGNYNKVPAPTIFQKDSSDKATYVYFDFGDSYRLNKLIFNIEGVQYFKRRFSLFEIHTIPEFIREGYLSSDSENSLTISNKTEKYLLKIFNEDNPPLTVTSIGAFQLNNYLITYLRGGKNYFLNFGDSEAVAPQYDLSAFTSYVNDPGEILIKSISRNKSMVSENKNASKSNSVLLWIIICSALIALSYITFQMINKINKRGSEKL